MRSNIKVSCVIPLYNAEKYIKHALNSLVNQKDCEIIIVNDGSTDASQAIVEDYAKKYNNIILITQKNSGPSVARNVGLTAASGEYVHFLDADDEVETDAYEKLYNYANTQKPDILIFDYYKYYVDSGKKVNKARSLKQNYNCATHKELVLKAGVVPWNKFFKRNFLLQNKLLFIENIAYEDVPFFWHTILVASKIYYMQGYFIKYNQYPNSRNTKTNLQGMIVANNLIFDFLSSNGEYKKYKNLFVIKMLKSYIFLLNTINSKEAFALVQDSIKFIHLKEYNISFVKYIKLYLLLKTNYTCYYLLKKIL